MVLPRKNDPEPVFGQILLPARELQGMAVLMAICAAGAEYEGGKGVRQHPSPAGLPPFAAGEEAAGAVVLRRLL
jgi:hypothetical protein